MSIYKCCTHIGRRLEDNLLALNVSLLHKYPPSCFPSHGRICLIVFYLRSYLVYVIDQSLLSLAVYPDNNHQWLWLIKNSLHTCVFCWKRLQTVWIQIRPDMLSGLIWIQTVWHSDVIPEEFKTNEKMSAGDKKHAQLHIRQSVKE